MDDRYELAHGLMELSVLIEDEEEFSWGAPLIEQAIKIICPDFYERLDAELEAEMCDPEAQKFVEGIAKSEQSKAFVADIDAYQRGEITIDEMKKKWGYGNK